MWGRRAGLWLHRRGSGCTARGCIQSCCLDPLLMRHPLPRHCCRCCRLLLPPQGAFVGALVAMSSTSIVLKVLAERRTLNTQPGQITIGTLILQARSYTVWLERLPRLGTCRTCQLALAGSSCLVWRCCW